MNNMINKLLKAELFFLFILTILSLAAFYFGDSLPDNYLSISSSSESIGAISYFYSSVIVFVGYYLGPWTLFPFLCFACFYTLKFSKRSYPFDLLNILTLSLGTLFCFYFFSPNFLGSGVNFILKKYISSWEGLGLGLLFLVAFLAGSFRSSFKDASIQFFTFLGHLPEKTWRFLVAANPVKLYQSTATFYQNLKGRLQVKLPSALKGDTSPKKLTDSKKSSMTTLSLKEKLASRTRRDKKNEEMEIEEVHFTPKVSVNENENTISSQDMTPSNMNPLDEKMSESNSFQERTSLSEPFSSGPTSERDEAVKNYKLKSEQQNEKQYYDIVTTLTDVTSKRAQRHPDSDYFEKIINSIQSTLAEFKIDGEIVNILKGPVVDTFELELGPGVKVSKVTNAESEISMALLGAPIRIVYPMVGRATVGIEVPRNPREIIYLDEVLSSNEFKKTSNKLPIAMGKDAFGEPLVVDLASMPHMLVAGATGAGKSVFINTLLVSLLVKKSPSQMKLILIDPKQLELALYANLPHLVMPVVTDAKTASISLLWACQEMERRYSILKELGVRNIEGFNEKLKRATPEMLAKIHPFYENEPEEHYELPYLVIIVDEFADLILTKAGKDIENNICRLAAKARAAGIHLVIATQRPSVDVITGLIKSNFPTRVSFRVTSSQDSRTILNSIGAEKLLGKGDMLYRHGTNNLRVHSSYVDEDEIEVLADKLENTIPKCYHTGAMDFLENGGEEEKDPYAFGSHISGGISDPSSDEEYFKLAVKTVVEHRTASASMLQRRLKIGYNRAANLIEEMESKGIVGPAEGSKRRKVLWSAEDLNSI
tara:strand:- start:148798 stop:151272 length:2475 start_codon:yes stop_codon:yes gene_type:complete